MNHIVLIAAIGLLSTTAVFAQTASAPLIVVEDRGGTSALPCLPVAESPAGSGRTAGPDASPSRGQRRRRRSRHAAGALDATVAGRGAAPRHPGAGPDGAVPDRRRRAFARLAAAAAGVLRELQAVGLVVNVESMAALTALRRLAPGLTLSPASGDDLAQRLGLRTTGAHHVHRRRAVGAQWPNRMRSRFCCGQRWSLYRGGLHRRRDSVPGGTVVARAEPAARPGRGLPDLRRDSPCAMPGRSCAIAATSAACRAT